MPCRRDCLSNSTDLMILQNDNIDNPSAASLRITAFGRELPLHKGAFLYSMSCVAMSFHVEVFWFLQNDSETIPQSQSLRLAVTAPFAQGSLFRGIHDTFPLECAADSDTGAFLFMFRKLFSPLCDKFLPNPTYRVKSLIL